MEHDKEIMNKFKDGDVININQTVNGCNLFLLLWNKTEFVAKYFCKMVNPRFYEYNIEELISGEEVEVIRNIFE
jgi:hypothetical protein